MSNRINHRMTNRFSAVATLFAALATPLASATDARLDAALASADTNRPELERALAEAPAEQRFAMEWLVARMPERDRTEIDAAFLLEHVDEAHRAWQSAPWREMVPREIFLDAILPYASISERRDAWREPMRELAAPIVAGARTPAEAATRLNQQIFSKTGVQYSTKRRRADQSSAESIEQGLASCSGLSILLIDACRSVGVPARFVGVPLWTDGSGNHSWVEIWDGERWRFTGAAEPTGDRLDEAWFTERARTAVAGDPRHGIYAVSWGDSPLAFPMSFDGKPSPSRAIDVTERYLASATPLPEGHGRMRIRVRDGEQRMATGVVVAALDGTVLFEGVSKDERFDANDHLFATLPIGTTFTVSTEGGLPVAGVLEGDSMLVDLAIGPEAADAEPIAAASSASPDPKASRAAVNALARALRANGFEAAPVGDFAHVPLTEEDVARATRVLVDAWERKVKRERMSALREGVVEIDGLRMPIWYQSYGERPKGGRSLFISMHGGGGAPPEVNSQQWENQKRLYRPEEGVYLAPRAPTDTWNLWHQGHIDRFFDRLIADLVVVEGVDPDRVYLMGYSAGGDGVYQLAPRMADRFAAASMMAGHPNETKPDGLRNLPFALWMGGNDGAFNRNGVARQWGEALGALAAQDPGGYPHEVRIVEGKGHWMDREDAAAVPWMATHTRNLRPAKVVWLQDDVVHPRFYWLAVSEPKERSKVVASRDGQRISIDAWTPQGELRVRLDDSMLDLDEEVVVVQGEQELFRGRVPRTIATLSKTLAERGDPKGLFSGEVVLTPASP